MKSTSKSNNTKAIFLSTFKICFSEINVLYFSILTVILKGSVRELPFIWHFYQ